MIVPPPAVEVVIPQCPPASVLFDDELPQDEDVQMLSEDEVVKEISGLKPASPFSPLPSTDAEIRESAPHSPILPPIEPQKATASPLSPVPPSSPSPPPSPIVEHIIPERAATPVLSITVAPQPEPETKTYLEAEAERPAEKVELSLQAWKVKKQAEKWQQQRAGLVQAQTRGKEGWKLGM